MPLIEDDLSSTLHHTNRHIQVPWKPIAPLLRKVSRFTPHWISLSSFGRNKFLRSSYFWVVAVPLLAHLLVALPDEVQVPLFGTRFKLPLVLPFSWRAFYFAAVAIAGAEFLYSWKCPALLQKYPTFEDFEKDGGSQLLLMGSFIGNLGRLQYFPNYRERTLGFFKDRFIPVEWQETFRNAWTQNQWEALGSACLVDGLKADAYYYYRRVAGWVGLRARIACSMLYAIGFSLLLYILAENFMFVVRACISG